MKWNRMGWGAVALSMLAAVFAPAAFAQAFAEGQGHNGLSSKAFRRNALTTNKQSLRKLLAYPLDDELFLRDDAYIGRQLRDPKAMAVMEELVECALDSQTEVTARDRNGNVIGRWRGELGLWQRWHTHALNESEQGQELITACLLARVNAVGKSIPLSLRSEQPVLSSLRDRVLTETRFRESPKDEDPSEGGLIPSFATSCQGPECNWSPAHVGTCVPGHEIQLAIDDPSACDSTVLRACAGIYGCVGPTVHTLPDGSPMPSTSRHLASKTGACRRAPLKLTCPVDAATAGYYSVMTRPVPGRPGRKPSRTHKVVKVKGSGKYPAPEQDVFAFPEGAFYGNLFQPEFLTLDCTADDAGPAARMVCRAANGLACDIDLVSGDPIGNCSVDLVVLPYRNVYACYTYAQQQETREADDASVAALNERLCNSPDANTTCFPNRPRRCRYRDPEVNMERGSHCDAMGRDGVFRYCLDQVEGATRFEGVITTYLNEPCDLLDEDSLCNTLRSSTARPGGSARGAIHVPPGPRGCGGCSLHGAGSALPPALLAAVLALLLRRRRRRAG